MWLRTWRCVTTRRRHLSLGRCSIETNWNKLATANSSRLLEPEEELFAVRDVTVCKTPRPRRGPPRALPHSRGAPRCGVLGQERISNPQHARTCGCCRGHARASMTCTHSHARPPSSSRTHALVHQGGHREVRAAFSMPPKPVPAPAKGGAAKGGAVKGGAAKPSAGASLAALVAKAPAKGGAPVCGVRVLSAPRRASPRSLPMLLRRAE